jgi:MurNAc alpha-1-phosphate uridylyltransferase
MTARQRPTTAFVLAAGLGTRMRPLTDRMPKPLVSLAGRPLLDHVLDRLADAGITKAIVNVHYLADQIEVHVAYRAMPAITISDERSVLLETGGGVVHALPMLGASPFVIHNSDSVWIDHDNGNLNRMLNTWNDECMDSLMLLAPVAATIGYDGRGDFDILPDGRLARRGAAPSAPYVFAGVSIAHPRLFSEAPTGPFSLNELWDRAIEHGRLFGIPLEGLWMHVGTPEALTEAEAAIAAAGKGSRS